MSGRPKAILTDIEGTTTPIAFVHDVLVPYARAHLPGYLGRHAGDPVTTELLDEVCALNGGQPALPSLLAWMDADAKVTPLKTLQGLIWDEGYRRGELRGCLFPDVAPALAAWHAAGRQLHVYSSGSEAAQRLLFGHSDAGDLTSLFGFFFDTRVGPKREAASYVRIAEATGLEAADMLFLSDVEAELDAALSVGFATCQLVRPEDGTVASGRHFTASDFVTVDARLW